MDRSLSSLPARSIDTLILVMIDYHIVEMIGKRCLDIFTAVYGPEGSKLVFTKRTEVCLGGFNV